MRGFSMCEGLPSWMEHSNPSPLASPLGTASRRILPSPVPPPGNQQCPAPQSCSKQFLLVSLSGLWATDVPKFLLIKSISTDNEMIAVLPYDFWRGEGLHFHGQPIGPLSRYGLLHLLLPMLHTDESLSFERRNEGIRKGCIYVSISSLLPLMEMRSMNESWRSLLKSPSVNQWCLQVNCRHVLEMLSSVQATGASL